MVCGAVSDREISVRSEKEMDRQSDSAGIPCSGGADARCIQ